MLTPMVRPALDPFRAALVPVADLLREADVLQIRHALLQAGLRVGHGLVVDGRADLLEAEGEKGARPQLAHAFAVLLGHEALDGAMQALLGIGGKLDVQGGLAGSSLPSSVAAIDPGDERMHKGPPSPGPMEPAPPPE